MAGRSEVNSTQTFVAGAGQEPAPADEWVRRLYGPLRGIAHRRLGQERPGHTLSTTALVHEAYLELAEEPGNAWKGRTHFLATASRVMRNVLVDYARRRNAAKRGGKRPHLELDEEELVQVDLQAEAVEALHEALDRLHTEWPRQAELLEHRYFGGLSIVECAEVLGVSKATVSRDLRLARAWLASELMLRRGAVR